VLVIDCLQIKPQVAGVGNVRTNVEEFLEEFTALAHCQVFEGYYEAPSDIIFKLRKVLKAFATSPTIGAENIKVLVFHGIPLLSYSRFLFLIVTFHLSLKNIQRLFLFLFSRFDTRNENPN
jgi:hypothetical protein